MESLIIMVSPLYINNTNKSNTLSINAKTDGFHERNAKNTAFNEGGTGKI